MTRHIKRYMDGEIGSEDYFAAVQAEPTSEAAWQEVADIWSTIGGDVRQSMLETADFLGGDVLYEKIAFLAETDGPLPDSKALKYLEERYPRAVQQVMDRAEEIAEQRRTAEMTEFNGIKNRAKRLGRGMLEIFG